MPRERDHPQRDLLDRPAVTPTDDGQPHVLIPGPSPNGSAPEDAAPPFALELDDFIAEKQEGKAALLGTPDDNVLPAGGLAILAALPHKGKTTLAVDLAFHLASGADWLGIPVPQPGRVLIIENEGPREPFRRKLEAKRAAWPHSLEASIHVHVMHWGRFTLADEPCLRDLQYAVQLADVVIADPLTTLGVKDVGSRPTPATSSASSPTSATPRTSRGSSSITSATAPPAATPPVTSSTSSPGHGPATPTPSSSSKT